MPLISNILPTTENFKTIKFYLIIFLIVLGFLNLPKPQSVYIKTNKANLYTTNTGKTASESKKILQTIVIYKTAQKNGYYLTDDFLWVKKNDIAFSVKDPVLQKFIKAEESKKKEKIKKEQQLKALKTREEAKIKKELKQSLDKIVKEYDIQSYEYSFYVNDIDWLESTFSDKKAFFELCTQYGILYTKSKDRYEVEMTKTQIKSNYNGEILGEYSLLHGYKFK